MNGRGVMVSKARVRVGRVESGSHRGELQMKLVLERKAIYTTENAEAGAARGRRATMGNGVKGPRIISKNAGQGMKNG